jgi:3-(methylthio)propionyl---CoA ligase
LGVVAGDRVATLGWNHHQHLEAYYAISGMGAICHTINPRLFPEQIAGIIQHAEDRVLLVDALFLPLVDALKSALGNVQHIIVMDESVAPWPSTALVLLEYEALLSAQSSDFKWPQMDEETAAALCYTSGTTGKPKGVLYSHRSTVLHAWGVALPDTLGLSATDSVLPVVPLFHANAWGLPYVTALVGAKLVLPGPHLDGDSLTRLMDAEGVTVTAGVPTVWHNLMLHLQTHGLRLKHLQRLAVGGAACPPHIIRYFETEQNVRVLPGWGMTETSPVAAINQPKAAQTGLVGEERLTQLNRSGRPLFGVEMRIVDETGMPLPHDGLTFGHLQVKGPWVCSAYYRESESPLVDGWFPTGDVALIDAQGFMQITDRAKDMIKSGGEWISSMALEQAAGSHPEVLEAAVVAALHPQWGERPLLLVVLKPGAQVSAEILREHLATRVAKWWLPDDILFQDSLPHTATGKLQKTALREAWQHHLTQALKTDP